MKESLTRQKGNRFNTKITCIFKMDGYASAILVVIVISGCIDCLKNDSPHCDTSTLVDGELIRTKLTVMSVNASTFEEPYQDYLPLGICLSNGTLQINWTLDANEGNDREAKLCYHVRRVRDMDTVSINCYRILVHQSYLKSELFCWIATELPHKRLYIQAIVTQQTGPLISHYTEFYVDYIDVSKKCNNNICHEPLVFMKYRNVICDGNNKISHKPGVNIEQVTFNSSKSATCSNLKLDLSRVTDTELEFHLNCSYQGQGELHIIYSVRGHFCHIYIKTYLVCETGSLTTLTPQHSQQQQDQSYHRMTLLAAIVVAVSVLITAVCVGVLLIKRKMDRYIDNAEGRESVNLTEISSKSHT